MWSPKKGTVMLVLTLLSALLATNIYAADGQSLFLAKYNLHGLKLINGLILGIILFRKSIGHQNRLNWFFGAVATVIISSQTLVFQRFFGTPGSMLNEGFNTLVLAGYFVFYLFSTWRKKES